MESGRALEGLSKMDAIVIAETPELAASLVATFKYQLISIDREPAPESAGDLKRSFRVEVSK